MLGHQLGIWTNDLFQVQLPLIQIHGSPAVRHIIGGLFLHISRLEPGDNFPYQRGGLAADIPLPVHQQFVEERQRLHLLGRAEVDGIGVEHAQIGPQAPPVGLAPGQLQQARKASLVGQAAHQGDIVLRAQKPQCLHRLRRVHKGHVFSSGGSAPRPAAQRGVRPQAHHVAFKISQLGVNKGVAGTLGVVHVVQFGKDHVERLCQGRYFGYLLSSGAALLLDAEVGINENQGFHRQIVQLQIPDGVVCGYVADVLHVPPAEPEVSVIVVQVWHPFAGTAAKLADVVPRRAGGHQSQINGHSRRLQIPRHAESHMMDSGNMLQSTEGGGLQPQTHHLIDVLPAVAAQKQAVAVLMDQTLQFAVFQQLQLPEGIRRKLGPLRVQQHLQEGQQKRRPRPIPLPPGLKRRVGKHGLPGKIVGKGQPALLRLRGEAIQLLPAQHENIGAFQSCAVVQRHETLYKILFLQQPDQHVPVGRQPADSWLRGQTAQKACAHLADSLFVHSGPPFSGNIMHQFRLIRKKEIAAGAVPSTLSK